MLPDSMNVGVIAENIKKLEAMVQEAGAELPTPEAGDAGKVLTVNNDLGYSIAAVPHEVPTPGEGDTGKIIKVGSNGYELATDYAIVPYSTTETDTGLKWVDGKEIYSQTLIVPEDTTTGTDQFQKEIEMTNVPDEVINIVGVAKKSLENNTYYFDLSDYRSANDYVNVMLFKAQKKVQLRVKFSDGTFGGAIIHLNYTKPSPVPSNETKKKTSKKGE